MIWLSVGIDPDLSLSPWILTGSDVEAVGEKLFEAFLIIVT